MRVTLPALLFLLFIFCGQAAALENITLQLRWDHQFQFAGYYAAKMLGYYQDVGLEVEIKSAVTEKLAIKQATDEVLSGRADFGIGAADIILANDATESLRVVASILQESGAHFYLKEGKPFNSLTDLVARYRIARNVNSLIDVEFQTLLRSQGIDPKIVKAYPHEPGLDNIIQNRVDVFPGYSLSVPYTAARKGLALQVVDPHDYDLNFYGDSLFTTAKLINEHPELVEKFVAASLKGWLYALSHKEELAKHLATNYPRSAAIEDPLAFNLYQATQIDKLIKLQFVELGHINIGRWASMHQALRDAGLVKGSFNAERLLWTAEQAARQQRAQKFLAVQKIVGVTLALSLLLSLFVLLLRKRVQQKTAALQHLNEELSTIYHNSPMPMFIVDEALRISKANRATLDYTGLSETELLGRRPGDIFHCSFAATNPQGCGFGQDCQRCLTRQSIFDSLNLRTSHHKRGATLTVASSTGAQLRHLLISSSPFQAAEKQVLVSVEDVTDYVNSQLAEQESEARFRAVADQAGDAMLLFDAANIILDVNQQTCRSFGYSREELIGKSTRLLCPETAQADFAEGPLQLSFETRIHCKGGQQIEVEVSLNSIDLGGPKVFMAALRDVTKRKLMEKTLSFIAQNSWALEGKKFLPELTRFLGESLGVSCALVGILEPDGERVKTVGLFLDGALVADVSYDLAGTPCENVMDKTICLYPANIQALFPEDEMLADLQMESYLGLPLWDSTGNAIGLIALLDKRPCHKSELFQEVLQTVAVRAAQVIEQEQQQDKLTKERQNYQQLFQEMLDAFALHEIILDDQGQPTDYRYLAVNPAFEKILGVSAAHVVGHTVRELFPDVEQYWIDTYGQVALTGESQRFVNFSKQFDAWFETSCYAPIKGQFAVTFVDATARKNAEEQTQLNQEKLERLVDERTRDLRHAHELLKQDEERLSALLQLSKYSGNSERGLIAHALEEVVRLTDSKIGYLHLVSLDQNSLELYVWSKATMLNCEAETPQHYPLEKAGIWADCVRLKQPVIHNHYQAMTEKKGYPEGHIHLTSHASVPVFADAKIVAIVGAGNKASAYTEADTQQMSLFSNSLWEIVKRKRVELALAAALEVAEKANRAKSLFLATMSHELRTPLTVILGYSHLIGKDAQLAPLVKKRIETINNSGQHLHALINDVLEISRIDSGKIELHPRSFDMRQLLRNIEMMFSQKVEEKGLDLQFTLPTDLPRYLVTDDKKLTQILINLLGNAIKFTDTGQISVTLQLTNQPSPRLEVKVQDTGCGISRPDMAKLFQPFTQAEAGRHKGGTGLGLVISQHYARIMGGDLLVSSTPGQGSLFTLTCKVEFDLCSPQERPAPAGIIGLVPPATAIEVLIVDDLADGRDILSLLLQDANMHIRTASNGQEALELIAQRLPELIITDLRMPKMDGYDLLHQLRNQPATVNIPVVAVSANALDNNRDKILKAGANAFVAKPYIPAELYKEVAEVLGLDLLHTEQATAPLSFLQPHDFDPLPAELHASLRRALQELDSERIGQLAEQVTAFDARLGSGTQLLIENYQYDKLLALLEHNLLPADTPT